MTYFPDLDSCAYFAFAGDVDKLKAVGWLDDHHPFATGPHDQGLVLRLCLLAEDPWEPVHFMGFHACQLCGGREFGTTVVHAGRRLTVGARNVFIPGDRVIYVTPSLVLHYILAHQYQPPQEFVDAVQCCPGMLTGEYVETMRRNGPRWLGALVAEA